MPPLTTRAENAALPDKTYRSPQTALYLAALSPVLLATSGVAVMELTSSSDRVWSFGIASVVLGLSVGPSLGHLYAGEYIHGWGMALLRAATLVYGSIAAFTAFDRQWRLRRRASGRVR